MSPLFIGLKYVSLKDVGLKDVMVPYKRALLILKKNLSECLNTLEFS